MTCHIRIYRRFTTKRVPVRRYGFDRSSSMTSAMRVDVRPPHAAFHSAARGGGDGALDAAVGGGDGEWDHLHVSRQLLSSGQESHS